MKKALRDLSRHFQEVKNFPGGRKFSMHGSPSSTLPEQAPSWGHSLEMQQDVLHQHHPILTAALQACFLTDPALLKSFIHLSIHPRHSISITGAPSELRHLTILPDNSETTPQCLPEQSSPRHLQGKTPSFRS